MGHNRINCLRFFLLPSLDQLQKSAADAAAKNCFALPARTDIQAAALHPAPIGAVILHLFKIFSFKTAEIHFFQPRYKDLLCSWKQNLRRFLCPASVRHPYFGNGFRSADKLRFSSTSEGGIQPPDITVLLIFRRFSMTDQPDFYLLLHIFLSFLPHLPC